MKKMDGKFHAVRHAFQGKFTTYGLYYENERFLVPNLDIGIPLGRREAYTLAAMFNGELPWPKK